MKLEVKKRKGKLEELEEGGGGERSVGVKKKKKLRKVKDKVKNGEKKEEGAKKKLKKVKKEEKVKNSEKGEVGAKKLKKLKAKKEKIAKIKSVKEKKKKIKKKKKKFLGDSDTEPLLNSLAERSDLEMVTCDQEKPKTEERRVKAEKRKTKKPNFWEKCKINRQKKGLIMFPKSFENKLYQLKKKLRKKGVDGEEIKAIINRKRRDEENRFHREAKNCCLNCRQPGHRLAECPSVDHSQQGTDICYRCGSTEHKLSDCKAKTDALPFAKCFICHQQGHLTRSCPQNERGVYPKGGSCKNCGSVNHLIKECPDLKSDDDSEPDIVTLPTLEAFGSADAEVLEEPKIKIKMPKLVKF